MGRRTPRRNWLFRIDLVDHRLGTGQQPTPAGIRRQAELSPGCRLHVIYPIMESGVGLPRLVVASGREAGRLDRYLKVSASQKVRGDRSSDPLVVSLRKWPRMLLIRAIHHHLGKSRPASIIAAYFSCRTSRSQPRRSSRRRATAATPLAATDTTAATTAGATTADVKSATALPLHRQTRPQRRIACGQTCRKARHARSVPLSERSRGGIRWIAGSHHATPGIGPTVLVQHAGRRTVTSCAF